MNGSTSPPHESLGKVAIDAIEAFARQHLDAPGPWLSVLAELASLGLKVAIDEANTARVRGEVLVVRDER